MTPIEAAIKDYQDGVFGEGLHSDQDEDWIDAYYKESSRLITLEYQREMEEMRAGI